MTNEHPIGNQRPARRTIVKGAAWAVPVVGVASAAPALAASPPVIVEPRPGMACKHPGNSCSNNGWTDAYRFTFCFENNSTQAIQVTFTEFVFADGRTATPIPATVTVPAGATDYCTYILCNNMGSSANGQAYLYFTYEYGGETISGSVQTGANELPPCSDCLPVNPGGAPPASTESEENTQAEPSESETTDEDTPAEPTENESTDGEAHDSSEQTDTAETTSSPADD